MMNRKDNGVTMWNAYTFCKDMQRMGASCQLKTGEWVLARPLGWTGLQRLKYIWKVWKGEADILIWPGQE